MSYRWVDHTAEVELAIEAASAADVFAEALEAVAELIGDAADGERVANEVAVAATDRAALLAAWLDELVFRAETEDLVPEQVEQLELRPDGVRALVRWRRGSPRHVVKGVTYHRLAFEATEDGFRATVVLDV